MSRVNFVYRRSEALRRRVLAETGQHQPETAVVAIDLSGVDAHDRQRLVELLGLPRDNFSSFIFEGYRLSDDLTKGPAYPLGRHTKRYILAGKIYDDPFKMSEYHTRPPKLASTFEALVLDADITAANIGSVLDMLDEDAAVMAAAKAKFEAALAEYNQQLAAAQADYLAQAERSIAEMEQSSDSEVSGLWARRPNLDYVPNDNPLRERLLALGQRVEAVTQARKVENERCRAEAQATAEAGRLAWINEHGSEFLRRAVGSGYDCAKRYVLERAAVEHPGAVLDYQNQAGWKSRSCPSEAALDLAEKVGGKVVWLTAAPQPHHIDDDDVEYEPFEEREAVVVEGYLGKYDVVYYTYPKP